MNPTINKHVECRGALLYVFLEYINTPHGEFIVLIVQRPDYSWIVRRHFTRFRNIWFSTPFQKNETNNNFENRNYTTSKSERRIIRTAFIDLLRVISEDTNILQAYNLLFFTYCLIN